MRAVVRRRLTPILVFLCAVATVWLAVLLVGFGSKVQWRVLPTLNPTPHLSSPSVGVAKVQPLVSFKGVWERPLFEPSRKPVPTVMAASMAPLVRMDGVTLSGTVLAGRLQVALLQDVAGKNVRVTLGDSYQGWRLVSLDPRHAVFSNGGNTLQLAFLPRSGAFAGPEGSAETQAPFLSLHLVPQQEPMVTRDVTASAPSATLDDTAGRRARLELLKRIVMQRRNETPRMEGGH